MRVKRSVVGAVVGSVFALALSGGACAADDEPAQAPVDGREMQAWAQQMGQALAGAGNAMGAVDFRELKKLLKDPLGGLKRESAGGERTQQMGLDMSQASARYTGKDETDLTIEINDLGSMAAWGGLAANMMEGTELDREDGTFYERTVVLKDKYKGLESYDSESGQGKIELLVGQGRFKVEISGNTKDMQRMRDALSDMDLGQFDQWAAAPAE